MDTAIARELIAKTRQLADALEASLGGPELRMGPPTTTGGAIQYDPERDTKPWAARGIDGTRREKDLTCVILFGQLYALNRRQGRGAARGDLRAIAVDAGYTDGRAWNGWGNATEKDQSGELWLNATGHEWMLNYADSAGLVLPEDLTTWEEPRA